MPSTILRPYFLTIKNRLTIGESAQQHRKRDILLCVVALIVMGCIYYGFCKIFVLVRTNPIFAAIIPAKIVQLLLYTYFILLVISNTVSAIGNLYNARNMELLLVAPLSTVRLFFAKFIETGVETSVMFFVFSTPAIIAYYHTLDVDPMLGLAWIAISIPFLIIPVGIGITVGTLFVQFAAAFWRRGIFLLFCLVGIGTWALVNVFQALTEVKFHKGGSSAIIQLIGLFGNPNPTWMPSRWAADLIASYVGAPLEFGNEKVLLLLLTAVGTTAMAYLSFDFLLLKARSAAGSQHSARAGALGADQSFDLVRRLLELVYRRLPFDAQLKAIMIKDLSSLARDRAQSLQMLLFMGIAVVYLVIFNFMSAVMNLGSVAQQAWLAFIASINVLFAGFILTAVMTRLVYPAVSLEGRAFWILLVAPIDLSKLIASKFWCWLPVTCAIGLSVLGTGIIAINADPATVLITFVIGTSLCIGCTGLAIGLGAIFASFHWESPNQIAVGLGTLVLLLSNLTLVLLVSAPTTVVTFFSVIPALRLRFGPTASFAMMSACLFFVIMLNLGVAKTAIARGAKALEQNTKT